jgi:hypothetical protein
MNMAAIITDIKYRRNCFKTTAKWNATLPGMGLIQGASLTIKWQSYSSRFAYVVSSLQLSQEGMKEIEKIVNLLFVPCIAGLRIEN